MFRDHNEVTRPTPLVPWMAHLLMALIMSMTLGLAACSSEKTADKKTEVDDPPAAAGQSEAEPVVTKQSDGSFNIPYTPPNVPVDLNGTPVEIAGAIFVPDSKWEDLGSSGEMIAHYRYGPLEDETGQAEVTVFFFGDKARDSEEIMDRWVDQISIADGRDARSTARVHSRQVGGMTAHVLSMDGIYTPPADGFDQDDSPVRDYYRLVGVVVEAPQGDIYFKLTGPDYTGRVMINQFMNMIYRIKKA